MKTTQKIALILVLSLISRASLQAQTLTAFRESYTLEAKKDYKQAIAALKKTNDDSYEVNLRQGWLHYLAGLLPESVDYYEKAITQRPTSIEARLGYVLPASTLNHWDQVTEQYQAVLRLDPNNTVTNYRMGLLFYYRKEYKNADVYFTKILKLYPFDHDSLLMLGWTKYRLGQGNEARGLFNRALLNTPTDTSAAQGLATLKQ
ncbi:tetratricopeptide repeat protein [Spirosoma areae]